MATRHDPGGGLDLRLRTKRFRSDDAMKIGILGSGLMGGTLSDAQRLDECGERGWMLAPARVVQEEARERRAPIFQHPDQCSVREMRGSLLF
jgi:hypothetical protein